MSYKVSAHEDFQEIVSFVFKSNEDRALKIRQIIKNLQEGINLKCSIWWYMSKHWWFVLFIWIKCTLHHVKMNRHACHNISVQWPSIGELILEHWKSTNLAEVPRPNPITITWQGRHDDCLQVLFLNRKENITILMISHVITVYLLGTDTLFLWIFSSISWSTNWTMRRSMHQVLEICRVTWKPWRKTLIGRWNHGSSSMEMKMLLTFDLLQ